MWSFPQPHTGGFCMAVQSTSPPAWQGVEAHLMGNCHAWRGQEELLSPGHYPSLALEIWAVPLLFQHYGGVEGWLWNLWLLFNHRELWSHLAHCWQSLQLCVCVVVSVQCYLVPDQKTQCVLGLLSYFILLSAGKISKCPVIFYGFISCTKCPAGT